MTITSDCVSIGIVKLVELENNTFDIFYHHIFGKFTPSASQVTKMREVMLPVKMKMAMFAIFDDEERSVEFIKEITEDCYKESIEAMQKAAETKAEDANEDLEAAE